MNNVLRILTPGLIAISGLTASAIPAQLGSVTHIQPDGTELRIRMVGNGDLHFTTTEDGTLLVQEKDGGYNLARLTDEGRLVSTGIKPKAYQTAGIKLTEEVKQRVMNSRVNTRASQSGMGKYQNNYPTTGNPKVPVILVEYQDVKFSDTYDVKQYFTDMIKGENFSNQGVPGSLKQYFHDQSGGKFVPEFDIYGPITLPEKQEYYGGNYGQGWDVMSHYMVSHALKLLDPEVDFSQYDSNDDGDIDFIYIYYAGYGENRGGGENAVWPHAGYLKGDADFTMVDGVWGNYFACSNELIKENEPEGMAAFVHEYSHIIGLPDLYTTDPFIYHYYSPGPYSVLDYGVYNNDGHTPPNFTAYERNALKWNEPIEITGPLSAELDEISTGQFYLIRTPKVTEFFLLENRQLTGWDAGLPNHGMVVWHIDYVKSLFENNEVNQRTDHQYVDLVEANNTPGYNIDFPENCKGFTFPGTAGVTEFTATSNPAFLTWAEYDLGLPITNIREVEGKVLFDVAGGSKDSETDAIGSISADNEGVYNIYSLTGVKVKNTTNRADLNSLPKGIYIINGKKVVR